MNLMNSLPKKWVATDTRASLGQGWNQSTVQPEINPGNFKALFLNFSPTGEKHNTTWRLFLTRSMKNCMTFSGVGGIFEHSLFIIGINSVMISPCSSRVNKLDTNPEAKMLFTYSKKPSSLMSWSVNKKVVPKKPFKYTKDFLDHKTSYIFVKK